MAKLKAGSKEANSSGIQQTILTREDAANGIEAQVPKINSDILGRGSLQRGVFSGIMEERSGFATSVKIWGNYVAIGAYIDDNSINTSAGAIHVYTTDGFHINSFYGPEVDTISTNMGYDRNSWDLYGDYLVAAYYTAKSVDACKVWVWHIHTGELINTFDVPTSGVSTSSPVRPLVALNRCWVAIGNGSEVQPIRVYHILTGNLKPGMTLNSHYNITESTTDCIPTGIAYSDRWIIVATKVNDTVNGITNPGQIHIYSSKGDFYYGYINQDSKDTDATNDYWGWAMDISGEYVAVSDWSEDYPLGGGGVVHVYDIINASKLYEIYNPNIQTSSSVDYFGRSLTIMGEHLFVAAPYEDSSSKTTNTGRIYCYSLRDGSYIGPMNTLIDFNQVDDTDDYAGWDMDSFSDTLVWTKYPKGAFISKMNEPAAIIKAELENY